MLGSIKRKANLLKFRLNLRNTLQKEDIELLQITKEEVTKEIERRNRKK